MKAKADFLPIELVNVTVTRAARAALRQSGESIDDFLERHRWGDWGNLDEDCAFMDSALRSGSTVTSEYATKNFDRISIYTSLGGTTTEKFTTVYLSGER